MKKYLFLMLLPMVIGLTSCDYHDKMLETGDLPTKTTIFISDYFPGCEIVYIDKDRDLGFVSYDVVLNCGANLEFDSNGEWTSVDCEPDEVPNGIIPAKILEYVSGRYTDNYIVKIERDWNRYTVELNNEIELVFDKDGNFKRIDN
jgi:hypothetical protein